MNKRFMGTELANTMLDLVPHATIVCLSFFQQLYVDYILAAGLAEVKDG